MFLSIRKLTSSTDKIFCWKITMFTQQINFPPLTILTLMFSYLEKALCVLARQCGWTPGFWLEGKAMSQALKYFKILKPFYICKCCIQRDCTWWVWRVTSVLERGSDFRFWASWWSWGGVSTGLDSGKIWLQIKRKSFLFSLDEFLSQKEIDQFGANSHWTTDDAGMNSGILAKNTHKMTSNEEKTFFWQNS